MNDCKFSPDDPKLTAFALGELAADEAAAVEAVLRSDPVARQIVADIRATAARIEAALQAEAAGVEEIEPAVPLVGADRERDTLERRYARKTGWAKLVRFPQLYFVISGAAAAAVTVLIITRDSVRPGAGVEAVYGELTAERRARAIIEADNEALRERLATYDEQSGATAVPLAAAPEVSAAPVDPDGARPAARLATTTGVAALSLPLLSQSAGIPTAAWTEPSWIGIRAAIGPGNGSAAGGTDPLATDANQPAGAVAAGNLPGAGFNSPIPPGAPRERVNLFAGTDSYPPRSVDDLAPGVLPGRAWLWANASESYAVQRENEFLGVWQTPTSMFSVDVDTTSYADVRRFLQAGKLPPVDAVRIEELLNYFPYRYPGPITGKDGAHGTPFSAALEVSEAPWAPSHRLVRIGLKGRELLPEARSRANLVFLLDVSGSMTAQSRLPMVKRSLRLLLGKLRPDDRVAIVTYAGRSGLALPSTPVANVSEILTALESLTPRRSTNVAMGIELAYDIANANFVSGGINRVVLCTDGDFNVGASSENDLMTLVEEEAKAGTFLTTLGFGMGRNRNAMLELLASKGRGPYGYVESQRDADYILGEQVNDAFLTIAKDVKIQVQFNPRRVASFRLLGFEDRMLRRYFKGDRIDTGEVGVGHTMTALYEIVPVPHDDYAVDVLSETEDLKYLDRPVKPTKANLTPAVEAELLTVYLRYKEPSADESRQLEFPLTDNGAGFESASPDFKFAAAVAQFGMQLRKSPHKGAATVDDIIDWATAGAQSAGDDPGGLRQEFIELVRRAEGLIQ